jgi:hypothetical protein
MAGTQSARVCSAAGSVGPPFLAARRNCPKTDQKRSYRGAKSISRRSSKKEIEMLNTVSRLVRPQMAILALWATINMFATSEALAKELSVVMPSAPSVHSSAELTRPIAALADSTIPSPCVAKSQRRTERRSSYVYTTQDFTPMTRDGCQFRRAELLGTDGPNGGWCWRITTECDQYLQGDCWYTSASAVQVPALRSVASTR